MQPLPAIRSRAPGRFAGLSALGLCALCLVFAACGGGDGGGGGGGGGSTPWPDPGPRDPMPAQFQTLDYYFKPELISAGFTGTSQNMPVKLAQAPAPDNRIFVSVLNGTILTIDAAAPHTQTVWATLSVLNGAEQGLLGIALSPNFASNGFVYVQACVNNVTNKQQIIRYTDSGGVGINPVVILDNLPTGNIHNSGALKFATDGMLLCTVGDAGTDTDAQQSGLKSGRLLRMTEAGGVPGDNPLAAPNEYEWCRGLRNSFGLCVHQASGIFVATENGPNSNDELNYLGKGKNFEWGAGTPVPGAQVGFKMRNWGTVIVPTGVTFHTGAAVPPGYGDNLFICSYDVNEILRFEMFGSPPVNINLEHSFATFTNSGNSNKPLDIIQMNDGSLLVSTFTAIWRIYARTGP